MGQARGAEPEVVVTKNWSENRC